MNASLRRTKTHWLFDYRKEWLRRDLMAGLITAAVVIPKAMAYATIAGLPAQVGLYTVLVPMGHLRDGRNVPAAEREHDNDAGHSGGERAQPRCRSRRSDLVDESVCNP